MSEARQSLFELLPAFHRIKDAEGDGSLQALMAILDQQLDVVEDDIRQMYNDWFIETCDEWLVPYIGDLLDVRGLQTYGTDAFSLRAYVANTLAYRRRKGTASVLEQLARDVTGWPARVVEYFQILETTQYLNHLRPQNLAVPDLRDTAQLEYIDTAFDRAAHTADVRHIDIGRGKHNIPNIGIHLWRLQSYFIQEVTAGVHSATDGRFYFNPLITDLSLFNRPQTETDIAHLAEEINLPGVLRRRPLYDDLNALRAGDDEGGRYFSEQQVLAVIADGVSIPPERIYICDLSDYDDGGIMPWRRPPPAGVEGINVAVDPALGRLSFVDTEIPSEVLVSYAYGFSDDVGGGPYYRRDSVQAWLDRFQPEVLTPDYEVWQIGVSKDTTLHTLPTVHSPVVGTLQEAIAAWNSFSAGADNAFGVISIMDNASYVEDLSVVGARIVLPDNSKLAIVAAAWPDDGEMIDGVVHRPRGRIVAQNLRPHIHADFHVEGNSDDSELILDGLLVEGQLVINPGDLGRLQISHCTLGATAAGLTAAIDLLPPVGDEPEEQVVDNLNLVIEIDHSILGPLEFSQTLLGLTIKDCIVNEDQTAGLSGTGITAIDTVDTDGIIQRCTIYGTVSLRTLSAENCIFTGELDIARRQQGCLRFCYVPILSRTPRRYRCQPDYALILLAKSDSLESVSDLSSEQRLSVTARVRPLFSSSRYGEADFSQLARRCATEIYRGGEDGAEMGVFYSLKQPQREANLHIALNEYLRFGLEAGIFFTT